ncbi:MAG: hypothetical protein HDS32_04895 [Bacteroides sp.]|nr:hypothetical protein [Bacteroides sp.]
METNTRRLVECERCGVKYAFTVPEKQGAYRIECPRCHKEIKFKVVNNK